MDFLKIPLNDVNEVFLEKVKTVYYFGQVAFMITKDDDCFSVGSNAFGNLGIGCIEPLEAYTEQKISILCQIKITYFSCGGTHVVALTEAGKIYTWGCNDYGQLGLGHEYDAYTPTLVTHSLSRKKIVAIACGGYHTLVMTSDGEVFGCGWNDCGQLGTGTILMQHTFVQIVGGIENCVITSISCGFAHSAAVSSDGEIFMWGSGIYGQTGVGNTNTQISPCKLKLTIPIKKVACGSFHTLALGRNGVLYAWGCNKFGQLGISGSKQALKPLRVCQTFRNITDILAMRYFSCCKMKTKALTWGNIQTKVGLCPTVTSFSDIMHAAFDADIDGHFQPIILYNEIN